MSYPPASRRRARRLPPCERRPRPSRGDECHLDRLSCRASSPFDTPWQSSSLVIQPASTTTAQVVLGDRNRRQEHRVQLVAAGRLEHRRAFDGIHLGALGQRDGDLARRLAERAASFQTETVWVPSATRFSAAWSPSWPETGMPCHALRRQRRDHAAGGAVVRGDHGIDAVVGLRSGSAPCCSGRSRAASRRYRPRRRW